MKTCERLVVKGRFLPSNPADLLAKSYHELLESKQPILGKYLKFQKILKIKYCHMIIFKFFYFTGSSTACVVVLNRETSMVYTANIGDSGFVIVRQGQVVHRSEEQQHYFNTPFQLSLPPPDHSADVLSDR